MNRRQAIKTSAFVIAGFAAAPRLIGQGRTNWEMRDLAEGRLPFKLPPLPYPREALQPQIDSRSMYIHHGFDAAAEFTRLQGSARGLTGDALQKFDAMRDAAANCDGIHALYVKNLNKTIAQHFSEEYEKWSAVSQTGGEKLLVAAEKWLFAALKDPTAIPEAMRDNVRNYGGGYYNHSLFWQMMKPNGGGEPKGELVKAIDKTFGSFGAFKEKLSDAALELFGSGWCWLTLDGEELKVETTQNEDTPLSSGRG